MLASLLGRLLSRGAGRGAVLRYVLKVVVERLRRMNENLGAVQKLEGVNIRVTANASRSMEESVSQAGARGPGPMRSMRQPM